MIGANLVQNVNQIGNQFFVNQLKPMPAPSISRRIPKNMQAPIRAYATVIGEVVWASNFAHGAFEILFSHVATHDNYSIGRAIWHTAPSDSGQLQML